MNKLRIARIIGLSLLSFVAVVAIALFVVLRYYEDDVVNYAIKQAKSQFTTTTQFGPADLNFWSTFPNASLRFTDVYVEETFATKDTLLTAREVYLEFNLLDLFRSKYNIEAISAEGVHCHLKINKEGKDNWHFWKTDASDTSEFKMDMQQIEISQSHIYFSNEKEKTIIDLAGENIKAKGNLSGEKYALNLEADAVIKTLQLNNKNYASAQSVKLEADMEVDNATSNYTITQSEVQWGKTKLSASGIINTGTKQKIDVTIAAQNVDLEDAKQSMPANARQSLEEYKADGTLNLNIEIKQSGNKDADVVATCSIHDGELQHKESGVALDNMACDLKYISKNKAEVLTIRSLKANMNAGYVQASGTIKNMQDPQLDLDMSLQAEMYDLKRFFAWDTLEVCTGQLNANTHLNGKIELDEKDSTINWKELQTTGNAQLSQGLVRLKNSNREFQNLEAGVVFSNQDARLSNMSGVVNGSDFSISGNIKNLLPFLTSTTEKLTMDANLKSNFIDFTNLVETNTSSSSEYHFELPERIIFNLNSVVKKFVFRKFEATDVTGVATLANKKFIVDPVAFHTADGDFSAQLSFEEATSDLYRMNCLATLKSINIQKLFTEFENFDQTFIQDKNLKGDANATVQFRTMLTTDLDVVMDKIESLIDITIDNGELNNLESLQDIASYIKSNKWAAPFVNEDLFAEKMRNIKFSKLENVIEIKNRLITIPQMDIKSTAMDISAKGTHTFDNAIAYTIGFSLRDVLVRKTTEWQVEDDGLGKRMYVSMKGTTGNPEFAIDKDAAKQNRQQEMQTEKQNVKALLKEEFGLFKKDNTVGAYKEKTTTTGSTSTLEWDGFDNKEAQKKTTTTTAATTNKTQENKTPPANTKAPPKKKVGRWLEEKK